MRPVRRRQVLRVFHIVCRLCTRVIQLARCDCLCVMRAGNLGRECRRLCMRTVCEGDVQRSPWEQRLFELCARYLFYCGQERVLELHRRYVRGGLRPVIMR